MISRARLGAMELKTIRLLEMLGARIRVIQNCPIEIFLD